MMPSRLPAELFVVPVSESDYLVYAPLGRAALLANAALVRFLRGMETGEAGTDADPEIASFLRNCGMLDADEESRPDRPPAGPPRPVTATLLLTNACNLRCRYCYAAAGEKPPEFMRMETARRAIDFVAANAAAAGVRRFQVDFHGAGEPTVHWRLLEEAHGYARGVARSRGLELHSSLTTNGVLTAGKRAWIVRHLNSANVSFDGLPEVQDANRRFPSGRGSSDLVLATLRAFDRAGFRYSIRMTVTSEAAPRLPQSVAFLCRRFRPRGIQVEPLYRMGRGRDAVNAETEVFIEAYRAARRTSEKASGLLRFSGARFPVVTNRFCGAANDNFCVSPAAISVPATRWRTSGSHGRSGSSMAVPPREPPASLSTSRCVPPCARTPSAGWNTAADALRNGAARATAITKRCTGTPPNLRAPADAT
jgi:uncharacterized protein